MKPKQQPPLGEIRWDTIQCADGPLKIARLNEHGYAVHEPIFATPPMNRRARRARARRR